MVASQATNWILNTQATKWILSTQATKLILNTEAANWISSDLTVYEEVVTMMRIKNSGALVEVWII